jgi:hypothetical protein
MGAKVYADRPGHDVAPGAGDDGGPTELERDVEAIAVWFEGLPAEWQSYFDREAESGRRAYGQA